MQSFLEIPYRKNVMRGMYHRPEVSHHARRTVVFFHGFTGNRIEGHRLFYQMSKALERVGIASVRFDFLGSGESDGDYGQMTLSSLVDQAAHVVSWTMREFDPKELCLLGFSLGGLVASLIAEQTPTVPKVVLISPGRPRRILERDKHLYETDQDIIDVSGNPVGRAYYEELHEFADRPSSFPSTQRILILHGTKDLATPIAFSDEYLSTPGGHKRLVTVEGADHGYSTLAWQRQLIDEVTRFLRESDDVSDLSNEG